MGIKTKEEKLWKAALFGDYEKCKRLLDEGVDVNAKNKNGNTALILAARNSLELVKLLINHGAEINTVNNFGWTAFKEASEDDNFEVTKFLMENGAEKIEIDKYDEGTPFVKAIRSGDIKIAKSLIEDGADVNKKDYWGFSALMEASMRGHNDIIKLLLEKGADVNDKNQNYETALLLACIEDHLTSMKILIENGANVNAIDREGWSIFRLAKRNGNTKIINLLENAGAKN